MLETSRTSRCLRRRRSRPAACLRAGVAPVVGVAGVAPLPGVASAWSFRLKSSSIAFQPSSVRERAAIRHQCRE